LGKQDSDSGGPSRGGINLRFDVRNGGLIGIDLKGPAQFGLNLVYLFSIQYY